MYFTTHNSPFLIEIVNIIVITWCILASFYVGGELSSNDGRYQISVSSFTKTS